MRIAFLNFWGDFNPQCNYFTQLIRQKYNVEIVDQNGNPNLVFFSGRKLGNTHRDSYLPKAVKIAVNGEPPQGQPMVSESAHLLLSHDATGGNNLYFPHWILYLDWFKNTPASYYTCSGSLSSLDDVFNRDISRFDKTEFCTYIAQGGGNAPVGHRQSFTQQLMQYKFVHCPSKNLHNCEFPSAPTKPGQGRPGDKLSYIEKFKFNVAFENRDHPGYVTEKIIQPLLTGCIPIYWGGGGQAQEIFNSDAFIYANDFNEAIEQVKAVDNSDDLYGEMISASIFKDNTIDDRFSPEYILEQIEGLL